MTETTGIPIRSLQAILRQISELDPAIPPVIPDGIYGRNTMASVSAFQRTHGLPVTGVADLLTWEAIVEAYLAVQAEIRPPRPLPVYLDRGQTIARGEHNLHIWTIQGILTALSELFENIPPVSHNGTNDPATQAAIELIQATAGLPVTGVVDAATWDFIAGLYAAVRNGTPDIPQ